MKRKLKIDPFFEREAKKYKKPIPSREFIIQYLEGLGVPEGFQKLSKELRIKGKGLHNALKRRLNAMIRDGQLLTDRRGRYALVNKMNLISGRVTSHRDGYGFLVPDDEGDDLFLSPKQMKPLFPGDRILASVISRRDNGKCEGAVVEILARSFTKIVGKFLIKNGVSFIIPGNRDYNREILIPKDQIGAAKQKDWVLAEIISYPTIYNSATARIVEVLGKKVTPDLEIKIASSTYGLSDIWSKAVIREGKKLTKSGISCISSRRRDLRSMPLVTIDGENAKDFDDAIYCEKQRASWILYVAIADVGHYVDTNSAIDQEALKRGTSVYFPNYVIPMLPEVLANDLCSIQPLVDRLAVVCEIKINCSGKLTNYKFYEAIICSKARLTYDEVHSRLEANDSSWELFPYLLNLKTLYQLLLKQRELRGALNFSKQETKIILNDKGKIQEIIPLDYHYVHGMVEEFMLLANVCTSKFLLKHRIPALYRVHEGPDLDRITNLRQFLKSFGLTLEGGDRPEPSYYAELLKKIAERKDGEVIQMALLKSMKQALYTPNNLGHFGLAYEEYTHFTSPIRRYPDLINHRAIKYLLAGKTLEEYYYRHEDMKKIGGHCSFAERRADDASKDVEFWYKCQFMVNKVGKLFDGVISGVMSFGLFVELREIFVEGLVHITSLKLDYYQFDAALQRLVGRHTGKSYRLGDLIKVSVVKVDMERLEINLELV